jgi:hypothetical protein
MRMIIMDRQKVLGLIIGTAICAVAASPLLLTFMVKPDKVPSYAYQNSTQTESTQSAGKKPVDDSRTRKSGSKDSIDNVVASKPSSPSDSTIGKENITPPKPAYTDIRGVKCDTATHYLRSAQLIDMPTSSLYIYTKSGIVPFVYHMPIFKTVDGYKTLVSTNMALGRGLIYDVEYRKFFNKPLTRDNLFNAFLKTDAQLYLDGPIDQNIEGIIDGVKLVNQKEK